MNANLYDFGVALRSLHLERMLREQNLGESWLSTARVILELAHAAPAGQYQNLPPYRMLRWERANGILLEDTERDNTRVIAYNEQGPRLLVQLVREPDGTHQWLVLHSNDRSQPIGTILRPQ